MALMVMAFAAPSANAACTTIQSGSLVYGPGLLAGSPLQPGFDVWGYNYQAHLFNLENS